MANEGFLGKTKISGERAATDNHPAIIHGLPLADTVTTILQPGTLMTRVEVKEVEVVVNYEYAPWQTADATLPCAVVDNLCDPASGEASAICVVHGTVKARLLTVDGVAANIVAIEKLKQSGIFAV